MAFVEQAQATSFKYTQYVMLLKCVKTAHRVFRANSFVLNEFCYVKVNIDPSIPDKYLRATWQAAGYS